VRDRALVAAWEIIRPRMQGMRRRQIVPLPIFPVVARQRSRTGNVQTWTVGAEADRQCALGTLAASQGVSGNSRGEGMNRLICSTVAGLGMSVVAAWNSLRRLSGSGIEQPNTTVTQQASVGILQRANRVTGRLRMQGQGGPQGVGPRPPAV